MTETNIPAKYFCISQKKNQSLFSKELQNKLLHIDAGRPLIFLCIGSDRATGDCLGPLVGQHLCEAFHESAKKAVVYGTLHRTVHAGNLVNTLAEIQNRFSHPYIIAIDASLGVSEHIGYVTLGEGCLRPGIGVSHSLPATGDIHITGIVNCTTRNNHITLQTTNLLTVVELARFIADGILNALHVRSSLQCPKKRHFINIF